jgi:hypothetical protein
LVPIPITYCFVITNTGETHLADITLDDDDLGTNVSDMTLLSGGEPLAPGDSIVYYYETELTVDLVNVADTEGNPVTPGGVDIPGLPNPTDQDPAEVRKIPGDDTGGLYTVPTLNTWGLLLMLILLGFFGLRRMRLNA